MGRLVIPNVKQMADGRVYFRRKVEGRDTYHRLPPIDSPEFAAEYQRLSRPVPERPKPADGTLAKLVANYRASSEYRGIQSSDTKENYGRYLDMIVEVDGHRTVRGVKPVHVKKMRDRHQDKPGKANNWLTVFRLLMAFAAQNGDRDDNPASGIKALKIGEHQPWPAPLLRVALKVASPMTRLAIATGLCSGQRVSDVIRMQYGWIRDGIMELTQAKTGVDVAIPMHPFWLEELARLPRSAVTLLYDRSGKPFGTTGAIQARLRDLMEHEEVREVLEDLVAADVIPEGTTFTFHGLRKNACCYLLELGLSDASVGGILGMSPAMVRHYGKKARALMIAREAAAKVLGGTVIPLAGVQPVQGLKKA
ncbi:tyrosine-type recombinase/integrase [Sphingosinicella sp. BN140058]|uniref:tyrosine-type recombinase/integrase n=1 Tax=Sphingosinicella sp. BN140058 TaxID=1892855 RepID=UPI001012AF8B|nr:tyrosine-type recombinase/integrase [Sphingosinicella sp. BN140058]QAY77891.1 hypothetical protein ETR14_16215 [Sphingosinicella sp. BN140058]